MARDISDEFNKRKTEALKEFDQYFKMFRITDGAPGITTTRLLIGALEVLAELRYEQTLQPLLRALNNFTIKADKWPQSTRLQNEQNRIIDMLYGIRGKLK